MNQLYSLNRDTGRVIYDIISDLTQKYPKNLYTPKQKTKEQLNKLTNDQTRAYKVFKRIAKQSQTGQTGKYEADTAAPKKRDVKAATKANKNKKMN